MRPLTTLADKWREEAELLRKYGDERGAKACEIHASELLTAAAAEEGAELTLAEAVAESGVPERTLRQQIADGRIPNAGRKGAPRIRRGDLPRRPSAPGTYDPALDARSLLSGTAGSR